MTGFTPEVTAAYVDEGRRRADQAEPGSPRAMPAERIPMISFTNEITIHRPAHAVFEYLADATNIPNWNYYVVRVSRVDTGPLGVGATFHQTRRTDRQLYAIARYEPPARLAFQTLPGERPAFTRTFRLDAQTDSSTRLTDAWRLEAGRPWRLRGIMTARVSAAVVTNLHHLKELLERGHTRLPDGTARTAPRPRHLATS